MVSYIWYLCLEWNFSNTCGWAIDVEADDHSKVFMRFFAERSFVPPLKLDKMPEGNYFLTQSLIAYMLKGVISEEAKIYFENNLRIVDVIYADEKRVNEIFKDNISPSERVSSIEEYEKECLKKWLGGKQ